MMTGTAARHLTTQRTPTVVCLHGSGASGKQWDALASDLACDFRVLAPDLLGHGDAPAWQGPPADILTADAGRVARLAAETGWRVHLVGHSYGATVALRLAILQPWLVASVAVYEPMPIGVLSGDEARSRAPAEIVELACRIRGDAPGLAQRDAMRARMRAVHAHVLAQRDSAPPLGDYRHIAAPVLYLCGGATRLSARRIVELVASRIPLVDVQLLPGMGHLAPITHPAAVGQRIASFVRRQAAFDFLGAGRAA